MSLELMMWMMVFLPPSAVASMITFFVIAEANQEKQTQKKLKEREEFVEKNQKIKLYEGEIRYSQEIDEIIFKTKMINAMIINVESIAEKENQEIGREKIKILNENIKESQKAINKFITLDKEEKEVIKPIIDEMINCIEEEIIELSQKVKGNKYKELKNKYEEKLEKIKKNKN